jgi:hypothetical protein
MPWDGDDYATAFIDYLGEGDGQIGASPGDTYRRLTRGHMANKEDEIGALWQRTSANGKTFLSGKINGADVVVFTNDHKQPGEKTPDWRVFKSTPRT